MRELGITYTKAEREAIASRSNHQAHMAKVAIESLEATLIEVTKERDQVEADYQELLSHNAEEAA